MLWQHRRLSRLGVPEVVADAKYGTTGTFLYLGQLGIPTAYSSGPFGVRVMEQVSQVAGQTRSSGSAVRPLLRRSPCNAREVLSLPGDSFPGSYGGATFPNSNCVDR